MLSILLYFLGDAGGILWKMRANEWNLSEMIDEMTVEIWTKSNFLWFGKIWKSEQIGKYTMISVGGQSKLSISKNPSNFTFEIIVSFPSQTINQMSCQLILFQFFYSPSFFCCICCQFFFCWQGKKVVIVILIALNYFHFLTMNFKFDLKSSYFYQLIGENFCWINLMVFPNGEWKFSEKDEQKTAELFSWNWSFFFKLSYNFRYDFI